MSIICRACLQNVDKDNFFYIDTFDNSQIANTIPKDVLQLCVPEMDLYISEQPGVCNSCLTMFENFYNFKNKCLASEEKILNYMKTNKIDPQNKINLTCVVNGGLSNPEERKLAELEQAGELDVIKIKRLSPKFEPKLEDKEVMLLSCNECSFVTSDKTKLLNHKCLPSPTSEKYKCPHCEYSSCRRYRLGYHINAKHTKSTWYTCQQCDYKTTDSSSLRRHIKVVHYVRQEGGQIFQCELCNYNSTSEVALQRHKGSKHGPAVQICSVCSYQTKDKSNFRKHLYIHGDKPKKCTKCSYQCVSPYQLERHFKRSHC